MVILGISSPPFFSPETVRNVWIACLIVSSTYVTCCTSAPPSGISGITDSAYSISFLSVSFSFCVSFDSDNMLQIMYLPMHVKVSVIVGIQIGIVKLCWLLSFGLEALAVCRKIKTIVMITA
jgi:hypothetical protein